MDEDDDDDDDDMGLKAKKIQKKITFKRINEYERII